MRRPRRPRGQQPLDEGSTGRALGQGRSGQPNAERASAGMIRAVAPASPRTSPALPTRTKPLRPALVPIRTCSLLRLPRHMLSVRTRPSSFVLEALPHGFQAVLRSRM